MKTTLFKRNGLYTLILLLLAGFVSCDNEEELFPFKDQATIPPGVLAKIEDMGFDASSVLEIGDMYVVEGDIGFAKSWFETSADQKDADGDSLSGGRIEQARFNGPLIAPQFQSDITVLVDGSIPSSGTDNWRTEVQAAINHYNNIADTRIHFRLVTSGTADITISSDGGLLPSNFLALASVPGQGAVGQPGPTVIINLDFNGNMTLSSAQKTHNMVHELGHCLALRHTNWRSVDFNPTGDPAVDIPGTPTAGGNPDPGSVMNGGTALNSWAGFTNFDLIAVRTLYPPLPQPPTNASLHEFGSALVILWTASPSDIDGYTIWQQSPVSREVGTTTSTSFAVHPYLKNGTNIFTVRAFNDVGSSSGTTVGYGYQQPAPPTNVSFHQFGPAHVILWTASTSSNVTGYTVKQNYPIGRTVGTTTSTSFAVNNYLEPGMNVFQVYSIGPFGLLSSGVSVGTYY
ncbi:MAG: M57 family metalloprotease [Marinoscillum sp.]